MPAIVEADDQGLYVLKFRGSGQGAKALIAELVAGEIARALGLDIPEIVLAELDGEALARTEADPEIQALIRASAGLNLALDYLPGSVTYDPIAWRPDADLASRIVWFDAYTFNVDRTAKNVNLLLWHGRLRLIDHGAALYFHHDWASAAGRAQDPFERIKSHVLLPIAGKLAAVERGAGGEAHAGRAARDRRGHPRCVARRCRWRRAPRGLFRSTHGAPGGAAPIRRGGDPCPHALATTTR